MSRTRRQSQQLALLSTTAEELQSNSRAKRNKIPAQQAPLLTAEELVPEAFRRPIGKSNSRADLNNISVPKTCEIIAEILKHHPIAPALTTSATVPIVYIQQFWQTVKFDESKTIMRFKIDQHEVEFSLDTFRSVLQLPQASDNENGSFVEVPEFSGIAAFLKDIGYVASMRILAEFFSKNLAQPWQTLFKIISRCTTGKSTGLDSARIGTLQILWGVVNKAHIDYAKLIWDDIIFQTLHPHPRRKTDTIPFPRYTKLIINHVLSINQEIPKRGNEPVHTPREDDPITQIYCGCSSTKVKGMRIPEVLLNDVIRATTAYKVYEADFLTIQPQPVESTRGTNRKTKTQRGGSKKGKQVSVEKPVQTAKEIDEANLQEAIEIRKALEMMANAALDREVEQMVEGDNLGNLENLENISEENDEPDTSAELSLDDDIVVGNGSPGVIMPVTAGGHISRDMLTLPAVNTTPKKSSSQRRKHLRRTVANITGHRKKKYTYFKNNFIAKRNVKGLVEKIVKEQLDATAPQQIQDFLRNYMQTNTSSSTINPPSRSTIPGLKLQLYAEMYANTQARAEDPELFEVLKKGLENAQGGSDTCNLRKRPRQSS